MADNLKDAEEDGSNSKDNPEYVKERIQETLAAMIPHEKKKHEANEEIKGLRRQLKKDTGITAKRFNAMRELTDIEDDDERHAAINEIRVCFEALSTGEQGDLFKSEDDNE